ncbi:hypothetical protein PFISCL1PPCAC_1203, partial [Pristionchus fissidentatus]
KSLFTMDIIGIPITMVLLVLEVIFREDGHHMLIGGGIWFSIFYLIVFSAVFLKNLSLLVAQMVLLILSIFSHGFNTIQLLQAIPNVKSTSIAVQYMSTYEANDVGTLRVLLWAITILTLINLIYEAVLCYFVFKAYKEVKREKIE